jgi:hypothetical protein
MSLKFLPSLQQNFTHTHSSISFIVTLSLIWRTACAHAQFSRCSSTTNAYSETGQMAVCCPNLLLVAISSCSALSVLVGMLFKKVWSLFGHASYINSLVVFVNWRTLQPSCYTEACFVFFFQGCHWITRHIFGSWVDALSGCNISVPNVIFHLIYSKGVSEIQMWNLTIANENGCFCWGLCSSEMFTRHIFVLGYQTFGAVCGFHWQGCQNISNPTASVCL